MTQEQKSSNKTLKAGANNGAEKTGNGKPARQRKPRNSNNTKQAKNEEPAGPRTPTRGNGSSSQSSKSADAQHGLPSANHAAGAKANGNKHAKQPRTPTSASVPAAPGSMEDDKFSGSTFYLSPNAASLPRPPFAKPASPEQPRNNVVPNQSSAPSVNAPSVNAPPVNTAAPPQMFPGPAPMQSQYPPYHAQQMPFGYAPMPYMYPMPSMPMMQMPAMPMNIPVMPVNKNQANPI